MRIKDYLAAVECCDSVSETGELNIFEIPPYVGWMPHVLQGFAKNFPRLTCRQLFRTSL